jgi:hypothetical protein
MANLFSFSANNWRGRERVRGDLLDVEGIEYNFSFVPSVT